jgi:GTP-sensing pleiotropic transcriptional regulator CodY
MNVLVEYGATAVTAELLQSRDEEPGQNKTKEGSM